MSGDRRKYRYLQWIPPILTIISIIAGTFFWIHTMTGIPPRVTDAEKRISELEKAQTAMGVKADLTLNAVYEIRGVLMKGK